ncbi:MAG: hypothetical protein E7079_01605 [Bacteroidales bacterium]|nr:hypothetical protein [Bacteroidales bacterium]
MRKLIHIFDKLPSWSISVVVLIVILILTLDSNPVKIDLPNIVGIDKMVHGIMFGGLAMSICLDIQRRNWSVLIGVGSMIVAIVISSVVGIIVEMLQYWMANGRTYEAYDIVADVVGVLIFTFIIRILLKKYGVE